MTYYNCSFFLPFHSSSWNEWDDKINTINWTFSNFILFLRMMMDITPSRAGIFSFLKNEVWWVIESATSQVKHLKPILWKTVLFEYPPCSVSIAATRPEIHYLDLALELHCATRETRLSFEQCAKNYPNILPIFFHALNYFYKIFPLPHNFSSTRILSVFRKITKQNKKKNLN